MIFSKKKNFIYQHNFGTNISKNQKENIHFISNVINSNCALYRKQNCKCFPEYTSNTGIILYDSNTISKLKYVILKEDPPTYRAISWSFKLFGSILDKYKKVNIFLIKQNTNLKKRLKAI